MQIDLRQIAQKGAQNIILDVSTLADWSESSEVRPSGKGAAELDYQRQGTGLRITGALRSELLSDCAVCGAQVEQTHEILVSATFMRSSDLAAVDDDLRDDDGVQGCLLDAEVMEEERFEGDVVDLASWLRDEWRLGLPLALRCPGEVCREAAASGQKAPVDPRWAGLAALRDTLPGGE